MHKQVIAIRKDLKLGKGKIASQVAHASLQAYKKASPSDRASWEACGSKKVVVAVGSKRELLELFQSAKQKLPAALIKDAGHTQVSPGEATAVGIGPAPEEEIDRLTGNLKLL